MIVQSHSSESPKTAQCERYGRHTEVWLRKNIQQDTADNYDGSGTDFYVYDELHFTVAGTLTEEQAQAQFDALWDEHKYDGVGAEELVKKLLLEIASN